MNKNIVKPLLLFSFAVLITLVGIWIIPSKEVSAQCTDPSSCKICHEIQGEKPVSDSSTWHQQHAIFDFCAACHGGERDAPDIETAHTGMLTSLEAMAVNCKSCHSYELETCLVAYADEAGADRGNLDAAIETALALEEEESPISQLESGTQVGPQVPGAQGSTISAPAQSYNGTANIFLLVLLVCSLAGGGVYVVWNERRLRRSARGGSTWLERIIVNVRKESWTPYGAGILLGLTGIFAVVLGKHILTASGPVATIASSIMHAFSSEGARDNIYFNYVVPPGFSWPVLLFIGVFFGGMLGALSSGTLRLRWSDDPTWKKIFGGKPWKRILIGFIGAIFLQYGAGIAGGCTSGLAISGGMLMAPSAFLFMGGMFASGILTAIIVYRRKY
ncbi:MAG: YeeE/YedE family protein [Anaerolineaceae bacterium]|nr:YeeE/YedE family protein [Anaerolineaceae bacterium]